MRSMHSLPSRNHRAGRRHPCQRLLHTDGIHACAAFPPVTPAHRRLGQLRRQSCTHARESSVPAGAIGVSLALHHPAQRCRRRRAHLAHGSQQQRRTRRGRQLQSPRGGQIKARAIGHHQPCIRCLQRHLGGPQPVRHTRSIHEHAGLPQAKIHALAPTTTQATQRAKQRTRVRPCMSTHPQHTRARRRCTAWAFRPSSRC